jgi:hypothetical protein
MAAGGHLLLQDALRFGRQLIERLARQAIRFGQLLHPAPCSLRRHHLDGYLYSLLCHYIISSCSHGFSPSVVVGVSKTNYDTENPWLLSIALSS